MPSFVDAHVHLWDFDHVAYSRLAYPWVAEIPVLNASHGIEAFDRASRGGPVEQFVFVECTVSFDDETARQEVCWAHDLARQDARLQGMVAHASLEKGEAIRPHLAWLNDQPLVRGVRRLLQDEPDPSFCLQPAFVEGVRLLSDFDFTFDVCVRAHQLPQVTELVRQCPEVGFVLDHLGKPPIREGRLDPWRAHLQALAECPNVACKVSGVLTEASPDGWSAAEVRPYLEHALDVFGTDRLLFGSDWPVLKQAGTYATWVQLAREAVSAYSEAEQRRLFRETAERVYRLDAA